MESHIKDAITFIHEYRSMENADMATNERLIKRVVTPTWKADHLCDSWGGRRNNFGSFFLNLDHMTQGDFIEGWGMEIPALHAYKTAYEQNPISVVFADPPITIKWLHELLKYFSNNGIGDRSDLILSNLPDQEKRYGNSTNWGNYILSLSTEGRELVLHQLYNQVMQ
ncbi:hypothetical protein [Dyadobacter psychrotolerans]|jgi:hypothetical protein|uniref:Uncharacterized protein n=1 Tax=Dyadobacter psychrotolerans TaxID=2541721 RepID=A0A4R5D891_9BACT|nr:hypothetical protein [Dyadobacter psychrotolerans]TDE09769.1 hypothetical protein E0F88_29705 [Dyadobacter psychrotolerans]